jgi:hypothetical protein
VDVLILQVFVSLVLVTGSVILFLVTCKSRTFDHADRLALLPIEHDGVPTSLELERENEK